MLSIIIPSLDDGKLIGSLIRQLPSSAEIIIVEAGNSAYFRALKRKNLLLLKHDKGRASQMNYGAHHANGNMLLFLHADSDVSLLSFNDINGHWGGHTIRFESAHPYFRFVEFTSNFRARRGIVFGDQGLFVSKDLFEKVGGFPEGGFEDIDISLLLRKIYPVRIVRGPIATSPRKFLKYGVIRTHIIIGITFILYILRFPERAKKLYGCTVQGT